MAQRTSGAGSRGRYNNKTLSADYTYFDDYAQSSPDGYDYSTSRASSNLLDEASVERPARQPRSSNRRPTGGRRLKKRRRSARPFGAIFGIVALLMLAGAGAYAGYVYHSSRAMRQYAAPLLENATVASQFPHTSAINLMLIGRDYDYDNSDQIIKSNARSDMLMVARVDFAHNAVRILSIPRDTGANIPNYGVQKINSANELGGPQLTEATVQQNFGIASDHYIALDFSGFQKAIDRIGGVDCTVDKKMDYDDNWGHLHIHLMPGFQHLDGEQAMGFVRFRHSDSDIIRTQRQQALLASLKQKLMQPQTLALIPSLLDLVNQNVDSNLTAGQKVALAKFVHAVPAGNLQMTTLPSDESRDQRLVSTNRELATPLIQSIFGVQMPQSNLQLASSETLPRHRHHRHRRTDTQNGIDGTGSLSATTGNDTPAVSVSEVRAPQTATANANANVAD